MPVETYQLTGNADAIQYSGTAENMAEIERNFGRASVVWMDALEVGGVTLAVGQWLVRFHDTETLKVYSNEAFHARFRKAAPITTTGGAR